MYSRRALVQKLEVTLGLTAKSLGLSLHRHRYLYIPPRSRFIRYNKQNELPGIGKDP